MMPRRLGIALGAIGLVGWVGGTARAEDEYQRLTLTVSALHLFAPVYQLNAELAVHERWSVAVRGGAGKTNFLGEDRTVMELGGQAIHYVTGNPSRGVQLGLDARLVRYEGDSKLFGLGDGAAVGPFVGYKRVFGSGFTLGGQVGAQVAIGDSDGPVLPYVALSLGVSFWPAGRAPAEVAASGDAQPPVLASPLAYHHGVMFGVSVGLGSAFIGGCDACELQPGLAVDASLGWFLHRRVAIMIDSTATVALFSPSSGFGSFGFGLSSLAVQVWPHEDFWLKVGVGAAQLTSLSLGGAGSGLETGGGGTLAAGWEFHHDRNFGMDLQLRASHGSFQPANGDFDGVDTVVGLVGFHWY